MSTGQGGGLPDFSGRGDRAAWGGDGYGTEPAGADPQPAGFSADASADAHAPDPYAPDPYAPDPHAPDPYAPDPYAPDPYAPGHHASDPYASGAHAPVAPVDPLATGPEFADSFADWSPEFGGIPQHGGGLVLKPTSDAALAGFVLSLVGLFLCCGITSPVAIFFAFKGMSETGDGAQKGGRGFAIAGLVLSILGLLYLAGMALYLVFVVLLAVYGS